jgi:hypothetical protein
LAGLLLEFSRPWYVKAVPWEWVESGWMRVERRAVDLSFMVLLLGSERLVAKLAKVESLPGHGKPARPVGGADKP